MLLQLLGHEVQHGPRRRARRSQAVGRFRPDVVLLDIGMPGLNGYEVAQAVRRDPGAPRALLVALTGWGQDEDERPRAAPASTTT